MCSISCANSLPAVQDAGPAVDRFEQASHALASLWQAHADGALPSQRAVSLAAVELEHRRSSCLTATSSSPSASGAGPNVAQPSKGLQDAIVAHFDRFGHLSSCASDLKQVARPCFMSKPTNYCSDILTTTQQLPNACCLQSSRWHGINYFLS